LSDRYLENRAVGPSVQGSPELVIETLPSKFLVPAANANQKFCRCLLFVTTMNSAGNTTVATGFTPSSSSSKEKADDLMMPHDDGLLSSGKEGKDPSSSKAAETPLEKSCNKAVSEPLMDSEEGSETFDGGDEAATIDQEPAVDDAVIKDDDCFSTSETIHDAAEVPNQQDETEVLVGETVLEQAEPSVGEEEDIQEAIEETSVMKVAEPIEPDEALEASAPDEASNAAAAEDDTEAADIVTSTDVSEPALEDSESVISTESVEEETETTTVVEDVEDAPSPTNEEPVAEVPDASETQDAKLEAVEPSSPDKEATMEVSEYPEPSESPNNSDLVDAEPEEEAALEESEIAPESTDEPTTPLEDPVNVAEPS